MGNLARLFAFTAKFGVLLFTFLVLCFELVVFLRSKFVWYTDLGKTVRLHCSTLTPKSIRPRGRCAFRFRFRIRLRFGFRLPFRSFLSLYCLGKVFCRPTTRWDVDFFICSMLFLNLSIPCAPSRSNHYVDKLGGNS